MYSARPVPETTPDDEDAALLPKDGTVFDPFEEVEDIYMGIPSFQDDDQQQRVVEAVDAIDEGDDGDKEPDDATDTAGDDEGEDDTAAASSRKKSSKKTTYRYQTTAAAIMENYSESSNTDCYSTDEKRSQRHLDRKKKEEEKRKQRGEPVVKPAAKSSDPPPPPRRQRIYDPKSKMHRWECLECTGKVPHIVFEISADGVQMQKRAVKCSVWPLMGQIIYISPCIHLEDKVRFYMPRNYHPVIIGLYHGTNKPNCPNAYLRCMFKEMRLVQKRGLCTMLLKFYIGDGPSRQFIKDFPSHSAYCGCERLVNTAGNIYYS